MNTLVIDDMRTISFPRETPPHARTSEEGIQLIKIGVWDELWLDYDLGGDDTGMNVVRYILDNEVPLEYIFIHSSNPVGAGRMQEELIQGGYEAMRVDVLDLAKKGILKLNWPYGII